MLMGRSCGGVAAMSTPSSVIAPDVGDSKPANSRSSVDLPQPEPPSSAKISPLLIDNDTPSTAATPSKRLTSCVACK